MQLSAQDALMLARADINVAKKAEGSKRTIIKHYRAAKKAFDNVDVKKTDSPALNEMIVAFQDLAVALDHSRVQLPEKAVKCRQRANMLR